MENNNNNINSICIFCGSKKNPSYESAVKELANLFLEKKIGLVYGGGTVGMMGVIANAVHDGGGSVYGVIPTWLAPVETSGKSIGKCVLVKTMHERKKLMYDASDAFIAMPGGFGTLDELLELSLIHI
eukprot:TRINITY_DN13638_c0_g1_i2.p2 TRINITY_DN13638_c0_g1~~TRINITY_DN13638_c0_g1_i2.p2  ORF type:complete len:128 (-),score=19.45 TRINITY_DN13638_c0_g1_i2:24-407(-)